MKLCKFWTALCNFADTDGCAIPERNGVLYQYHPEGKAQQKTFHISLGPDDDGKRRACFYVGEKIQLTSVFLKQEGPFDRFHVKAIDSPKQ